MEKRRRTNERVEKSNRFLLPSSFLFSQDDADNEKSRVTNKAKNERRNVPIDPTHRHYFGIVRSLVDRFKVWKRIDFIIAS